MIIFKDVVTDDDMFSDAFPIKENFEECFYYVKGKTVTRTTEGISDSMIGGNKSAEDETVNDDEASSECGVNICLNHRLVKMDPFNKKTLGAYLKEHGKRLKAKKVEDCENIDEFSKSAQALFKKAYEYLKDKLKDFDIYAGPSMDPDGTVGFLNYEEDGVTPYMLFLKCSVTEEKY